MTRVSCPRPNYLLITAALLLIGQPLFAVAVTGVVKTDTGAPLANMVVAAYTATGILQAAGTTDAFGRYGLDLPAGSYRMLAYDNAGVFATTFAGNAESFETTPTLTLQSTPAQVDFTLIRGGIISGQVTFAGAPIRDVVVAAYNLSGTRRAFQTVDVNGRYSLVLQPGTYKLVAFHTGGLYAPQFHAGKVTFENADPVTVVAGATVPINFSLASAASVLGIVRDSAGRPLRDITVIAYTESGAKVTSATTDVNGQFSILLGPGTYRLVAADFAGVYAAAFVGGAASFTTSETITLRAGEFRSGIVFTLQRGGKISGKIIDRDTGMPLPNIVVQVYNPNGTMRTDTTTNADGIYTVVVPPGSYKIAAFDPNGTYALQFFSQQVTFDASTIVAASESAGFIADFQLMKAARLTGRVLERGFPAPGVTVAAYTIEGDSVASTTTDALGRFAFSLPPGVYKFLAYDPLMRFATVYAGDARTFDVSPARVLNAGATDSLDFSVVRGGKISGTVRDSRGQLVAGADVAALDSEGRRVAVTQSGPDGRYTLVAAPGTYVIAVSDPWRRYTTIYHRNAITQRLATPIAVTETSQLTVDFILQPVSRHRAAHG